MQREQGFSARLATASRWPLGVALTSWRYLWRTTPLHRDEVQGSLEGDSPPPLPAELQRSEIQTPEHGTGPLRCIRIAPSVPRFEGSVRCRFGW
jgi:hypothetical protein